MRMSKMKKIIFLLFILSILMTGCTSEEYEVKVDLNIKDAGYIIGAGIYKEGEEVKLAALPKEGYEFANWTIDEEVITEKQIHGLTVDENTKITANFEKKEKSTIEINLEEKGRIELISNNDKTKIKPEAILDDNYELITLKENQVNEDKKTIKLIYKQKNIDELIEKADKALGEKRWSDAGEYLLEAYNSGSIKYSEYYNNSYEYLLNESDIEKLCTDLKEEKIITKDHLESLDWNSIKPENPRLDILEKEDKQIFNWFRDYYEFHDYIRFLSYGRNLGYEEDFNMMSENSINYLKELSENYSEKPIHVFLMSYKKLIDNGIYVGVAGGMEEPPLQTIFKRSEFIGLEKGKDKLKFEIRYPDYDKFAHINMDEYMTVEIEISIKDDGIFRVGDIKFIT
jgi:hypothetical protein